MLGHVQMLSVKQISTHRKKKCFYQLNRELRILLQLFSLMKEKFLLTKLKQTKSNAEFFESMNA